MKKHEVTKWLMIMKANLNSFPEVSNAKKIEALAEAIRLLKNEQSSSSEIPTGSITKNDKVDCEHTDCNIDYKGCSNCILKDNQVRMCDIVKENSTYYHVCPYWKPKENKDGSN